MDTVEIGFGLQFKTKISASTGRQILFVDTVDVLVNINKNDIKLHIGGGVWTDLASLFEVFFKGTVVDEIRDNITKALTTTLPDIANKALEKNDGLLTFPWSTYFVTFDWESPDPAVNITDTYLGLATKGLFFENGAGEVEPAVAIPKMPFRPDTAPCPGLNLFASTYSIDSFFTALLDA